MFACTVGDKKSVKSCIGFSVDSLAFPTVCLEGFLSVVFSDLKIRAGVPLFSWYFILVALWVSWLWDLVSVSSLANVSHDSLG